VTQLIWTCRAHTHRIMIAYIPLHINLKRPTRTLRGCSTALEPLTA